MGNFSNKDGKASFDTTQWSMVLAAGSDDSHCADEALLQLCATYWVPLYTYARRKGQSIEDAEDLVQGFIAQFITNNTVKKANPQRGKFRTYLLSCFSNFITNEWDKAHAQKRGGNQSFIALDFIQAENQLIFEPSDPQTPENLYEKQWALSLIDKTLSRLKDEALDAGNAETFEQLKVFLTEGTGHISYADAAEQLGKTEGSVKTAVHRLRNRYRDILREEVVQTVDINEDIEQEIQHLIQSLSA